MIARAIGEAGKETASGMTNAPEAGVIHIAMMHGEDNKTLNGFRNDETFSYYCTYRGADRDGFSCDGSNRLYRVIMHPESGCRSGHCNRGKKRNSGYCTVG
ncbi:hypothetical protein GOB93_15905 [Acetobacter musti]|uniref:Uncharacterized protein n=1 Tax=Acetobacter musti TaxID=864732 RepID=A0ABX0JSC5_9PROT|nr:hypothetical protein [Acetobacter musti]NHN86114.1 hypothetical protein [Acetobacter musti]